MEPLERRDLLSATITHGETTTNSWQLADAGKGTLNGSYTFDGFENLTGNGQSDSFRFLFSAVGPGFGTVNGGSGNDVLDYSAVASPVFVNLLSRSASGLTVYSSVESFIGGSAADDLLGSNSATTWTINGTDSGTAGTIPFGSFEILHGGSGNDLFTLVGAGAAVTGSLHGGDGTDTLAGPALANNWTIESAGGGTLRTTIFAGIENLTGGSGADSFAFVDDGDIDGVINGGSGTDILSYALVPGPIAVELVGRTGTRLGSFTSIESLVATGDSGDVLSGSNATNAWSITSQNSGTVGATAFSGFEELVGGTGADTYTMTNAAARISGLIDGASGTDTLVSPPVNSMWLIDVPGGGSLTPRATTADTRFKGIENLTGGSLEDYFRMGTTGQVPGNLNGGSGNNVLSYETWSTAVVVNLQTNVATAVTGALSNIAVVLGGGGSDLLTAPSSRNAVLVGNGGNDVLTGGGGRNVLIGGNGADTLRGSGGDDLLIAGRTSFDLDPDALLAVFAEWSTTSRNYVTRVANLRGTGSGTRLNGNYFLALNDTIFGDEGAVDLLTGGSGRDWFFGNSGEDQISDRVASGTQLEYLN